MWSGWPLERVLYVILGLVFLAIFVQVTLFHSRQNFRHPAMWFPVIATPLLGVLALVLAWTDLPALRITFAVAAALGLLIGLVGTYFHVAGVGGRVDGYTLNNFMVGPPPMLPLMVSVMSALGLVIVYMA